ncbi:MULTISPECIES: hypothetical protein [Planobispora]|uniref:Uncharacterized protein n=2 Tax=Planobispora TaxID=29298 RepID=A0A8J3ST19_9ACTN|nr:MULTISPECIES: hypothetical protein [Planobispora]GIH95723.1 hypothetical protein Psi01_63530 [Planobispora siamensis]GIH98391.1 hypothetical protein Pta02_04000 [Planobispora takensis]
MNSEPDSGAAVSRGYEIRIRGRVGESFQSLFEGLKVTLNPVETVVRGDDLDQAALYALLERIQTLGLELVEIRRLPLSGERP